MKRALSAACLLLGVAFAVAAAWIPVKAQVAQVLMRRAWDQARGGAVAAKPWPWADTWPVGRRRRAVVILTTCYPFDAIIPGGPLRYIVVLS